MRRCENDDNFDRYRQRKKLKRRSACKRMILRFTVCICLAVMIVIACHVGRIFQNNVAKQPLSFPDTVAGVSEKDFNNIPNDVAEASTDETSWCLILTNKWNPIPNDYKVELTALSNGELIDTRIYPALQKMFDNARNDVVYPIVASGYRTTEKQENLMSEKINDYENEGYSTDEAKTKAETWVAIPGTSEHQLGIAVDINADGIHSTGDEVYKWLAENAYKYGFINRYPPDKTEITGVINEPWHYRYVGVAAATEIKNQGICLEEYLDKTN